MKMEIDTENLIAAIRSRPALYCRSDSKYYCHGKHKTSLWTEVCKEVFPGWDDLKPQYKVEYGHELQKRWKSLRTCFTRELALQRKEKQQQLRLEKPFKRRKRYEYFDMLSFLLDPDQENGTAEENEANTNDPLDNVKNEPFLYEVSTDSNESPRFETATTTATRFENAASSRYDMESETSHIRPTNFERNENLEDKISDMLKEIKKGEEDEDRQFMLSLVPSFRKLNDKQKFEARIEILKVLQNVTFKDSSDSK